MQPFVRFNLCPSPIADGSFAQSPQHSARWCYEAETILGDPGHVRREVTSALTLVDYVRLEQLAEERQGKRNGEVGDSFVIPAISSFAH